MQAGIYLHTARYVRQLLEPVEALNRSREIGPFKVSTLLAYIALLILATHGLSKTPYSRKSEPWLRTKLLATSGIVGGPKADIYTMHSEDLM